MGFRLFRELNSSCLICLLCAIAGCGGPTGPKKYSVSGVIKVNGEPAERVAVLFHHEDKGMSSNLRFPTGVTNAEGVFHLSSTGEKDGAVAGTYTVTFSWLSSPDLDAYDMLNGAFGKPETSQFQVKVPLDEHVPLELDLTISEDKIMRSRPKKQAN